MSLWETEPEPLQGEDLSFWDIAYSQYPWHEQHVRDISLDLDIRDFKELNYPNKRRNYGIPSVD